MNPHEAQGVLAIWNDIRTEREVDFESWYKFEHFPERLGVPGFRVGRRYEAMTGAPRYFCYYLTDTPDTLTSPAYVERLNNPTPLTRSMMSDAFQNMSRTVCQRAQRFGALFGAFSVTARFHDPDGHLAALPMLEPLSREDGIARCELWSAADQGNAAATEEKLRGGDRKIAACVMVETLRASDAERVEAALKRDVGNAADVGIYRLLCQITSIEAAQ